MGDQNRTPPSHKRVMNKKNGNEIKDIQYIESQAPLPKAKGTLVRVCCPLFVVLPSLVDIVWQCSLQYIHLFPLSTFARIIRKTSQSWWIFVVSENFFMVLIVMYNTFLVWSMWKWKLPLSLNRPAARDSGQSRLKTLATYCRWLIILTLLIVLIMLPFWWRNFAWSLWRRSLWKKDDCSGWDFLITMDTIDYREFSALHRSDLSKASIWNRVGSNYTMQLEHPTSSLSRISLQADDGFSAPYLIDYNSVESTYIAPNLSGTFTDFPVLSFPDLLLYSRFPNYTWNWECDAPGVALTDGKQEIVRTTIGNYDDCTMLRVCGRGSLDRLVIPLGAILIEMEKSGLCCTSPFVYVLL